MVTSLSAHNLCKIFALLENCPASLTNQHFQEEKERWNVLLTLGPEAADQFVAWMVAPSVSSVMIQLSEPSCQSLHNHLTWLLFPTYHRLSPDMWRTHIFRTISTISSRKGNFRQIVVGSLTLHCIVTLSDVSQYQCQSGEVSKLRLKASSL